MAVNGSTGVLDGVRILELARWQAAPRGGLILQDMGAEVLKLEWRKGADLRNSGPFVGGMSVQFAAYNRGKKSVTLNTRHDKGKELFFRLLEVSDVVLENFRPGTMEQMGFSYEEMCKVNPGIILASVSGFGQYGPYRDRQCFDPIIQAMSGFGDQTGRGFGEPIMGNGPVMDRTAALHAVIGILGALRHRDRTGEGQWLEVAMLDGGITLEEVALAMCYDTGTNDFVRVGTFLRCKDGWVTTGAARAGMWERMLRVMKFDELAEDPGVRGARCLPPTWRRSAWNCCGNGARNGRCRRWRRRWSPPTFPFGRGEVDPRGAGRQPHVGARGDDGGGRPRPARQERCWCRAPPLSSSRRRPRPPGPYPKYGEHNGDIYGDLLGMSETGHGGAGGGRGDHLTR